MKDKSEILKKIKLFVLDMDGTFYLSDDIIPGSLEFLRKVQAVGKQYMFFTNNSSRTSADYIEKLAKMDCQITSRDIMTSGDVTIQYLNTYYKGKKVYLMGTEKLRQSFLDAGICLVDHKQPDVAVAAFDMELTYDKLTQICNYVRNGAVFLATHLDINCPTATGFIPDCGAFCAAIARSTGMAPKYLGKPFEETLHMILNRTGFSRSEVAFVGDRLYTDVATGVKNGAAGILVLSGETKYEDIASSEVKPDAVFQNLAEIAEYL